LFGGIGDKTAPLAAAVDVGANVANIALTVTNPIASIAANCAAGNCSAGGVALAIIPGGRLSILFRTAHYAKRLQAGGLNVHRVEAAVQRVVRGINPRGEVSGRLTIDGVLVQWRAFVRPDGSINIGTIHLVR
jgi:hypothetical protein